MFLIWTAAAGAQTTVPTSNSANTSRRRAVKLETNASPTPPAIQRSASRIKAFRRPSRSPRQVINAVATVAPTKPAADRDLLVEIFDEENDAQPSR